MTTITDITTEQFLKAIFGSASALIYFNVDRTTWKDKPQPYSEAEPKLEWLNNDKYKDIYFIVNSGGSKDSQITHLNSAFIDWDAGRDSSGNYFPIEIVAQKKQEFLQLLAQFPYKPTFVVETRNGYHVYWLLYPGCTAELFHLLQKALINHFGSDPKVCNPARVMRLPGYYASKSGKYAPFFVNIVEYNDVRYSVDILLSALLPDSTSRSSSIPSDSPPPAKDGTPGRPTENSDSDTPAERFSAHNNTYINKEYTGSIIMGTYSQSSEPIGELVVVGTMEEAVDYICKQDIVTYYQPDQKCSLEEGTTTTCPFHHDSTPSGSIHYHEGYCYFTCHSKNCSFGTGTLIKIIQKKEGLYEGAAAKKLMKHYNIVIDDTWKEKEQQKMEHNLEVLQQYKTWKEDYPHLYNWISRIRKDLESKNRIAKEHIELRTSKGKPIFFCSLTQFERIYRKKAIVRSQNNQNQRVDRYCLLGLMEKIHESDIPYGLWRKTQKIKGEKRHLYRIQYYHVPEYTHEVLSKANEIAGIGRKRGVRLNAITKNSIRDIYGEEAAQRIYPQTEDIAISDSSKDLLEHIEQIIRNDIAEKGYTRTSEIIEQLSNNNTWGNVHDRRVKSLLPGLQVKLSLQEKTANNELKAKYGIESNGYPKIILPVHQENRLIKGSQMLPVSAKEEGSV